MKICHLADTHLGAGSSHSSRGASGLTLRQEDIIKAFSEAIDRIIELKPDICLHAGDLFDSVRPLNRIIAIAGEQLFRLAEQAKIPTVIIMGNHDAPKQPYIGAALDIFRQIENLHICCGSGVEEFVFPQARVLALPHCLTTEILQRELKRCEPSADARFNIFLTHGVAAGMPEFSMAELGEQELPIDMLDRFDYSALGHFHNHTQVSERGWYCGSTERLSQSEREAAKGFLEVDLEPFSLKFHEVSTRVMVDIPAINASGKRGDQLLSMIEEELAAVSSEDKIVRLTIEDVSAQTLKTMPPEAIAEIRRRNFDLKIRFAKESSDEEEIGFGRTAIGSLGERFVEFLDSTDLTGFDRERLLDKATKFLASEE